MSDEDQIESEVDLEQKKGGEPESEEESVIEDDDEEEVIDQNNEEEEVVDDDDDNNEAKDDEKENVISSKNQKGKSQSKPKDIPKREQNKQQSIPLHTQPVPLSNVKKREQQTKNRSSLVTEANQGGKSIFTKITESIFQSYLNTEEGHKPRAYDFLVSEDYLAKIKDQDNKNNKEKFNDMLDRQYRFIETVNSKKKQRKERQQEELKSKCTWTPSGMKQDIKVRNPGEFYTDQLRFLEEKKNKIQKKKEDLDAKNAVIAVPVISRNSKKIAETNHPNETEEEFLKRLKNEKLKTVKEKMIKDEENVKQKPKQKSKSKKKTINEMNELVTKLHAENEKMHRTVNEERMKKIAQEAKRENNLLTDSTKKIFLDKIVNSYEKALLELFNRKDNFLINFESYFALMSKIGFTLQYNLSSSTEEPNANSNGSIMKIEEELLKESFSKYLNPNDERIDTHYCLLFFLTIIGIYKGKNYQKEQLLNDNKQKDKEKEAKDEANSKKTIEEAKQRKKTPEEFIKCYIPELDLDKYHYSIPAINTIKTRYRLFYDNLSCVWTQELNNKRNEKQNRTFNKMNSTLDKSNNNDLKVVAKHSNIKESSRKKIIAKASEEIDQKDNSTEKALRIEEVYDLLKKKKEKELMSLRTIKEKEDMKECTFQPNAHTKKISSDISANIEKLYTDGKVTYQKKLQSEDYKKTIENRELEQCTFKPDIHAMNDNIKNNPLDKDTQLKNKLERKEQARIDREILSMQKKKGIPYMGYSDPRTSNEHNAETAPTMRFDIEKKTFKDTFNTFESRNKANTFNSTRDTKRTEKQKPVPLLNIEVNIDDNNQIVKLEIFPGDDPIKIAEDFCSKHGLSNDKKEKLQRIIQEKLNEAIGENNSMS